MDLLLTHGYFLRDDPLERAVMKPYVPLGILYLSSHLKACGLDVEVFDTTFRARPDFERLLDERQPEIVGVYCNLMSRRTALSMIASCKERGCLVVVGGPEPSSYVEEYLDHGADVVVAGEGELTLEELVPHLLEHGLRDLDRVAGIAFRGPGGEVSWSDPREQIKVLDAQPFPDREAVDIGEYMAVWREHHGRSSVSLITARGCPYKCSWCSHGVYGYSHRRRSPANVAGELEMIVETYRPDMVWYADDVFTISNKWMREYAAELQSRGLRVPFETISREDRLNEEMVALLAQMGCFRLWIGSESGSQKVLDAMRRRTDAGRVREMVRLLQAHGIEAGMFIMLGYEGEELEDLEETVDHLKAALPDQFLTTVAYPIKGTPYYETVKDRVAARRPWAEGSDRDLTVLGRRSPRFYRFATRWMVNELAVHRMRNGGFAGGWRLAKSYLNARVGQIGMLLTRGEVDRGLPA